MKLCLSTWNDVHKILSEKRKIPNSIYGIIFLLKKICTGFYMQRRRMEAHILEWDWWLFLGGRIWIISISDFFFWNKHTLFLWLLKNIWKYLLRVGHYYRPRVVKGGEQAWICIFTKYAHRIESCTWSLFMWCDSWTERVENRFCRMNRHDLSHVYILSLPFLLSPCLV